MKRLVVLLVAALVACSSAPPHKNIEQAYFKCEASKSLEGGIYGKGPFQRFGPHPSACSSAEWLKIGKAEFQALAMQWHGKDWSSDIPFWRRPEP